MSKTPTQSHSSVQPWLLAVAAMLILCGTIWWWTRSPPQLREEQYATTIALYRVCNQRSEAGLHEIESLLQSSALPSGESDPSRQAIEAIIAVARQSHWQQAMQDCRKLLDSQVQR